MEYNITLNMLNYILVLSAFGTIGSFFQAHKKTGSFKPFTPRIICGVMAGSVTMLVVKYLKLENQDAVIHFSVAAILGFLLEKGEGFKLLDIVFVKGGKI